MTARRAHATGFLVAFCVAATPVWAAGPAPPPPSVLVAPVALRDVAPAYDFIGRVTAIQSVQIVPARHRVHRGPSPPRRAPT